MKVALIGAIGNVGQKLLAELLNGWHAGLDGCCFEVPVEVRREGTGIDPAIGK